MRRGPNRIRLEPYDSAAKCFLPKYAEVCRINTGARCFRSAAGDARISMIDVRDIAEVAVKALTERGHSGNIYAGLKP